jgi:hypothetical protein
LSSSGVCAFVCFTSTQVILSGKNVMFRNNPYNFWFWRTIWSHTQMTNIVLHHQLDFSNRPVYRYGDYRCRHNLVRRRITANIPVAILERKSLSVIIPIGKWFFQQRYLSYISPSFQRCF